MTNSSLYDGNPRITVESEVSEQLQALRLSEPSRGGGTGSSSRASSEPPSRPVDDGRVTEAPRTSTPGRSTSPNPDVLVFEFGNGCRSTSPSLPDSSFNLPTGFQFPSQSPVSFGTTPERRPSPSLSPGNSRPSIPESSDSLAHERPIRRCRSRSVTPTSLRQLDRTQHPQSYSTPAIPQMQTRDSSAIQSPSSAAVTEAQDSSLLEADSLPNLQNLNLDDVAPYDVREEPPPSEPFFSEAYQEALDFGHGLVKDISASLSHCGLARTQDSEIGKIWHSAQKLEKFDQPETRVIGIVGDSGSGMLNYMIMALR